MKYSGLAILTLGLLMPCALKADLMTKASSERGNTSMFLSIEDNKKQRRVDSIKSIMQKHGGEIKASRFDKADKGQKGYRYNCVLQTSDKVSNILSSHMGATEINDISALVVFKSKKSLFSKNIDSLKFVSPKSGFEGAFSWFKNEFTKAPWEFLQKEYPSDFTKHCKTVDHNGRQMLKIKKSEVTVQLFPKGMKPNQSSIFYEWSSDTGDLFFGQEGGDQ